MTGELRQGLLRKLAMSAQRRNVRVPSAVRPALRRLVAGSSAHADLADGWTRSLLGDRVLNLDRNRSEGPECFAEFVTQPSVIVDVREQLRCLLVTESLDVGGMDEVVAFLARRLPELGFRTAVLHAPHDPREGVGRLARELLNSGIIVQSHQRATGDSWMRSWRPQVISVHSGPSWPLEVARTAGIPTLETIHGMHSLFGADQSEVVRRSAMLSGVIPVSELVREQYLELNSTYPPERVVTVPNGVRPRCLSDRRVARDHLGLDREYLFLSLARHCLQKNTYGLLRAFEEVADRESSAHLLVAGRVDDPHYMAQVQRLKRTMRHGDRVHLRDHLPYPELLLAAADGFVLDSFFEGWSLASMDALAAGLPVVLADVGGAREQINGANGHGYLVSNPLGDPLGVDWEKIGAARFARQVNRTELVEAMHALIRGRDGWLAQRTWIAASAHARFSLGLCLQRHAHVLRAAAAGRALTLPISPIL